MRERERKRVQEREGDGKRDKPTENMGENKKQGVADG